MKNDLVKLAAIIVLPVMFGVTASAFAAPVTIPYPASALDPLLSAKYNANNNAMVAGINNVNGAQITDSSITGNDIASRTITQDNMGHRSVGSYQIDSGAISSDTMFAPGWYLPAERFISSSDTIQNAMRSCNGIYYGTGTDSRIIYCTHQGPGQKQGGSVIPFTVTRVEIRATVTGHYLSTSDVISDSLVFYGSVGGTYPGSISTQTIVGTGLWGGAGNSAFANTSDSHGFYVNNEGGASLSANSTDSVYVFTAYGY